MNKQRWWTFRKERESIAKPPTTQWREMYYLSSLCQTKRLRREIRDVETNPILLRHGECGLFLINYFPSSSSATRQDSMAFRWSINNRSLNRVSHIIIEWILITLHCLFTDHWPSFRNNKRTTIRYWLINRWFSIPRHFLQLIKQR